MVPSRRRGASKRPLIHQTAIPPRNPNRKVRTQRTQRNPTIRRAAAELSAANTGRRKRAVRRHLRQLTHPKNPAQKFSGWHNITSKKRQKPEVAQPKKGGTTKSNPKSCATRSSQPNQPRVAQLQRKTKVVPPNVIHRTAQQTQGKNKLSTTQN